MKKYVQHKSGQGEQWEVDEEWDAEGMSVVRVKAKVPGNFCPLLPCSEYIPCDPPEEWENVTDDCSWGWSGSEFVATMYYFGCLLHHDLGLRLRKINGPHNGPCFIVERKKS